MVVASSVLGLTSTLSILLAQNMLLALVTYQMVTFCFCSCGSGTLSNYGIPTSPCENCVLVMPVGATWWQKERLETAA